MKLLFENWRKFINEQDEPQSEYQIFCDLDGVLVDLISGVSKVIYADPPPDAKDKWIKAQKETREALNGEELTQESVSENKTVRNFMFRVMAKNSSFWANLDWMPGGKELWNYIKQYNPIILSRPTDSDSEDGKREWVEFHLGLSGEARVKVEYDKSPFAQHEGKTGILIDDFEKNTIAFENSGGIAILYHGNPTVAIKKLKEFGF